MLTPPDYIFTTDVPSNKAYQWYSDGYLPLACQGSTAAVCGWETYGTVVAATKVLSDLAGTTLFYESVSTDENRVSLVSMSPTATVTSPSTTGRNGKGHDCSLETIGTQLEGGFGPSCLQEADSFCEGYSDTESANTGQINRDVWCTIIMRSKCENICMSGSGPVNLLRFVLRNCNGTDYCSNFGYTDVRFDQEWIQYTNYSSAAYAALFPWSWKLQFDNTTIAQVDGTFAVPDCPSTISKILAFAAVNLVVGLCSLLLGRRDVVSFITLGVCGKKGSKMWPVTTVLVVALNTMANYVNALITQKVPGFGHVPVGQLTLLWASRPRMAWVAALLISVQKENSIYFNLAVSSLLGELIQQCIGSYYLGMTVGHAAKYGCYKVNQLDYVPHGKDAHLMYSGAMLWLCSSAFFVVLFFWRNFVVRRFFNRVWRGLCALVLVPFHRAGSQSSAQPTGSYVVTPGQKHIRLSRKSQIPVTKEDREDMPWQSSLVRMGFDESLVRDIPIIVSALVLPWLGQWLFWTGFLKMASSS